MINEKLKPEEYEWFIYYLLGKLFWLYNKLDPMNIERNWENFENELNQKIRNHHNEKPNTANIQ